MARFTMVLVLAGAACALAAKDSKPSDHPDYPRPLRRGKPCPVKQPGCLDLYTEEDAMKLADLGDFRQVAVMPPLPPGLQARAPAKRKRKTACREGGCRRAHRKGSGAQRAHRKRKQQRQQQLAAQSGGIEHLQ